MKTRLQALARTMEDPHKDGLLEIEYDGRFPSGVVVSLQTTTPADPSIGVVEIVDAIVVEMNVAYLKCMCSQFLALMAVMEDDNVES